MLAEQYDIYNDSSALRQGIILLLNGWDVEDLSEHLEVTRESVDDLDDTLRHVFGHDIIKEAREEFPVSPGDVVNLTIDSISKNADGVGYVDGGVIFVEDRSVEPGDVVRVRIIRVKDTFAIARVVKRYHEGDGLRE